VPITNPKYRLTKAMVDQAPDAEGVFGLWHDEDLIYVGRALPGATIRARLREQLKAPQPCARDATHYSWELSLRPAAREAEILAEHLERHGRLPRCNDAA
jgi:hypothetical protein